VQTDQQAAGGMLGPNGRNSELDGRAVYQDCAATLLGTSIRVRTHPALKTGGVMDLHLAHYRRQGMHPPGYPAERCQFRAVARVRGGLADDQEQIDVAATEGDLTGGHATVDQDAPDDAGRA
jgi:hypothetical protein